MALYYFKIYEGDELVHEYHPIVFDDGTEALLDYVTGTIVENTTGGAFTTPIIYDPAKGDKEIEYVSSTGTQYALTNYTPNENTSLEMKVNINSTSGEQILFGSRKAYQNSDFSFWSSYSSNMVIGWGRNVETTDTYPAIGQDVIVTFKDATLTIKDINATVLYTKTVTKNSLTEALPIALLAFNSGGTIIDIQKDTKFYYCKIYEGDTLVRDFRPVIVSDTPAIYDFITETLFLSPADSFEGPPSTSELVVRYSLPEETIFPGDSTGTMIDTGISQVDMANGYCIVMVITPAVWTSYRGIFGYHGSTSQGLCGFQCEGAILNYACFPSSGIQLNVSTVPVNTKQQLVVNYDPSTGLTTIYRNGVALGSATMGGPEAFGNIIIGRAFASDNRYYKGTISSFDIYNRAATEEELATIFSSFTPEQ